MLKLFGLIKKKEGNKVLSIRVLAIINPTSGKRRYKRIYKGNQKKIYKNKICKSIFNLQKKNTTLKIL